MRIVIVGAGFGGIGTAILLRGAGFADITILERGARVGGVWNRNDYPGAACDVPSHLYSYSFARNPRWDRRFATQPVIQRYLEDTARRFGVLDAVRADTDVTAAAWQEDSRTWRIETEHETLEADLLVTACGQLSRPALPDVPGLERFAGPAFHSADWRHDLDLTGLRVGVLGTGASAIQFVPRIQPRVGALTVFQRTPPWVMPKADRAYARATRSGAVDKLKRLSWWTMLEGLIAGFVGHPRVLAPFAALSHLQRRLQVKDPVLRRKLTPDYQLGCKRILLSSDWYPAITAPNAEVVTERVREVTETGIVLDSGREIPLDVIIFGTGFQAREFVAPLDITGRDGIELAGVWGEVPHAWHGLSVPRFPNLFLVYGPNTYGGSGSAIYVIESEMRHVLAGAEALRAAGPGAAIELRPEAHAAFLEDLHAMQRNTIWATGGCRSWYLDDQGRDPTNWPGYTVDYRRRTARIVPEVYALSGP